MVGCVSVLLVLVCYGRLRFLAQARVQQAWRVADCTHHFPTFPHASLWSAPTDFTIIPSPGLTRGVSLVGANSRSRWILFPSAEHGPRHEVTEAILCCKCYLTIIALSIVLYSL